VYRVCVCVCVCVCVWEFGTGELAASQADGACPIPYSAGSLVRCCTVHQTSTAETGILDGLPACSSPCAVVSCTDHTQKGYLYFKWIFNNFSRLRRLICSIRLTLPNYSPRHYFTQAHRNRIIVKTILKLKLYMFFCRLYLTFLSKPKLHKWYTATFCTVQTSVSNQRDTSRPKSIIWNTRKWITVL